MLGQKSYMDFGLGRVLANVHTGNFDLTLGRRQRTAENVHDGRLARTVGPEQSNNAVVLDGEAYLARGPLLGIKM